MIALEYWMITQSTEVIYIKKQNTWPM